MKKKSASYCRATDSETLLQLSDELLTAFPFAAPSFTAFDVNAIWHKHLSKKRTLSQLSWDFRDKKVFAYLLDAHKQQISAVCLTTLVMPNNIDLKFANAYVRVFNQDVNNCADFNKDEELWETLRQTRMVRAIARMTGISTVPFLKTLATIQDASHLQYEGIDFLSTILISNSEATAIKAAGKNLLNFDRRLFLSSALPKEKWIRAVAGHADMVLSCFGKAGTIIGVTSLENNNAKVESSLILPGELQPIASFISEGTVALARAKNGDLYLIVSSGASFVKSHGKWYYLNYESLKSTIRKFMADIESTQALVELVLDASHTRKGALYCIPEAEADVSVMVADYKIKNGPNYVLRQTSRGLSIKNTMYRKFVSAGASVDGATILSKTGEIYDVACMIAKPDKERISAVSSSELPGYPGARSTAASNASIFGTSIKISSDGPITVFHKGKILGQIGA